MFPGISTWQLKRFSAGALTYPDLSGKRGTYCLAINGEDELVLICGAAGHVDSSERDVYRYLPDLRAGGG